jgi:hypothetical protein
MKLETKYQFRITTTFLLYTTQNITSKEKTHISDYVSPHRILFADNKRNCHLRGKSVVLVSYKIRFAVIVGMLIDSLVIYLCCFSSSGYVV